MRTLCTLLTRLLLGDSGQDLIEYALICAFIALGCVAGTASVSGKIASRFGAVGNTLSSLSNAGGAGGSNGSGGSKSGGSGSGKSGGSSKGGKGGKKKKG